jgi:ABC-type multidrug transport system ATPase subunit
VGEGLCPSPRVTVRARNIAGSQSNSFQIAQQNHFASQQLFIQLSYGQFQALRGASFELNEGELLGLLGPNGAGKTSLLRCLSGRRKLAAGNIKCHLNGVYQDLVGVVPQEIALYEDLTVMQNLLAFARFQGIPTSQLRGVCREALDWARLRDKSQALVRTLSGACSDD